MVLYYQGLLFGFSKNTLAYCETMFLKSVSFFILSDIMADILQGGLEAILEQEDAEPNAGGEGAAAIEGGPAVSVPFIRILMTCVPMLWCLGRKHFGGSALDKSWKLLTWYSLAVLMGVTLLVSYYTQATSPAVCLYPGQLNPDYVHTFCGANSFIIYDRYFKIYHSDLHFITRARDLRIPMSYYSFFPMVFLLAAIMCYIPEIIWNLMSWSGKTRLLRIIHVLKTGTRAEAEAVLLNQPDWAILKLITVKFLSIIIAGLLSALCFSVSLSWPPSYFPVFPKSVLCDLAIPLGSRPGIEVLRCQLPQNYMNEQVCIGLGGWFGIVALANLFSLCSWILNLCCLTSLIREVIPGTGVYAARLNSNLSGSEKLILILLMDVGRLQDVSRLLRILWNSYCRTNHIHIVALNGAAEED